MLPASATAIDGVEYLLIRGSERVPGYMRLGAAETRWVLRDWAQRRGLEVLRDLCRTLGLWRSPHPPGDIDDCIELLALRFDVGEPDLVLHRKIRMAVALDLSALEDVVDLADAMELTPEPELHRVPRVPEPTFVAFALLDDDGEPVCEQPFSITLPDGRTIEGITDAAGRFAVEPVRQPGTCTIRFGELVG